MIVYQTTAIISLGAFIVLGISNISHSQDTCPWKKDPIAVDGKILAGSVSLGPFYGTATVTVNRVLLGDVHARSLPIIFYSSSYSSNTLTTNCIFVLHSWSDTKTDINRLHGMSIDCGVLNTQTVSKLTSEDILHWIDQQPKGIGKRDAILMAKKIVRDHGDTREMVLRGAIPGEDGFGWTVYLVPNGQWFGPEVCVILDRKGKAIDVSGIRRRHQPAHCVISTNSTTETDGIGRQEASGSENQERVNGKF